MLRSEGGRTRDREKEREKKQVERGVRRGNDPAEARGEMGRERRGTGGNCETADGRITLMGREQDRKSVV